MRYTLLGFAVMLSAVVIGVGLVVAPYLPALPWPLGSDLEEHPTGSWQRLVRSGPRPLERLSHVRCSAGQADTLCFSLRATADEEMGTAVIYVYDPLSRSVGQSNIEEVDLADQEQWKWVLTGGISRCVPSDGLKGFP